MHNSLPLALLCQWAILQCRGAWGASRGCSGGSSSTRAPALARQAPIRRRQPRHQLSCPGASSSTPSSSTSSPGTHQTKHTLINQASKMQSTMCKVPVRGSRPAASQDGHRARPRRHHCQVDWRATAGQGGKHKAGWHWVALSQVALPAALVSVFSCAGGQREVGGWVGRSPGWLQHHGIACSSRAVFRQVHSVGRRSSGSCSATAADVIPGSSTNARLPRSEAFCFSACPCSSNSTEPAKAEEQQLGKRSACQCQTGACNSIADRGAFAKCLSTPADSIPGKVAPGSRLLSWPPPTTPHLGRRTLAPKLGTPLPRAPATPPGAQAGRRWTAGPGGARRAAGWLGWPAPRHPTAARA